MAPASPPTPDAPLSALRFLLGRWEALAQPGEPAGGFTFGIGALGRVIVRTNFADYPATAERPALRHEDLLIIYADPAGGLHGDYYDSEGHVIRYAGQARGPGELALVSAATQAGPGFRLAYRLQPDGTLAGSFEIASPEQPGAFLPYLAWSARKVETGKPLRRAGRSVRALTGSPNVVRAAQALFFVNTLVWLSFGVVTLTRMRANGAGIATTALIVAGLMAGNAAAMLAAGLGLGRRRRSWYYFALAVLAVNIALTFTDQVGAADLATLLLDLILLGLLLATRAQYLAAR